VEKLKRYWWVGVCSWALLAFVSWHYESSCGVFLSSACLSNYWEGVRWIALLKWVSPYQTLIAGVFAVAGGAFALIAARHSTATSLALEDAKSKRAAVIACSIVADEFRDASARLVKHSSAMGLYAPQQPSPFAKTADYMAALHNIDPMLGSIVSGRKVEIDALLGSAPSRSTYNASREALAKSYIVWHMLLSVSRNLDSAGRYDLRENKLPIGPLPDLLRTVGVEPRALTGLYEYFNWPTV
jgi:hypothetical protein